MRFGSFGLVVRGLLVNLASHRLFIPRNRIRCRRGILSLHKIGSAWFERLHIIGSLTTPSPSLEEVIGVRGGGEYVALVLGA